MVFLKGQWVQSRTDSPNVEGFHGLVNWWEGNSPNRIPGDVDYSYGAALERLWPLRILDLLEPRWLFRQIA